MNLINWSDSYSVKVPSIDAQHQKLVEMINYLNDAMMQRKGREALGKILADLQKYTVEHFKYEESLMDQAAYAKIPEHKAEHAKLISQVLQLKTDFDSGKATISVSVMNFLSDWLRNHILGRDMDYSAAMVGKGLK